MRQSLALAAPIALALAAAAPLAAAQSAESGTASQQAAQYDDTTLRAFAQAAGNVRAVLEEYGPQLQAAEGGTAEERSRLQQEVSAAMREAVVETDGIGVETYVEIARAAQSDQALADRITAIMDGG